MWVRLPPETMSVSGFMYNINATKKLGEVELNEGLEGNRSWHHQFRHSAYVFVGGLHVGFTEGDVVIMFSQFGEIVDVNLVRDRSSGKSKGFAFVCFEDQRSTVLAVDNMNGYQLLNKTLRVDHCEKYKAPKEFDEDEKDEDGNAKLLEYKATGAEGAGQEVYNVLGSQRAIAEAAEHRRRRPVAAEPEDEDEAWARAFAEGLKGLRGDGGKAAKRPKDKFKKELQELKRMKREAKKLEMEAKKAKKEAKERKKERKAKKGAAQEARGAKTKARATSEGAEESSRSCTSGQDQSSDDRSSGVAAKRPHGPRS